MAVASPDAALPVAVVILCQSLAVDSDVCTATWQLRLANVQPQGLRVRVRNGPGVQ